MKRLYHQFYLTIVLSLVLLVAAAGAAWRFGSRLAPNDQAIEMAGEVIAAALPSPDASPDEQHHAIERLAKRLHIDLGLYDAKGALVASEGRPVLPRGGPPPGSGWVHAPGGPAWAFRLPDGRTLVARAPSRHRAPAFGLMAVLGGLALAVALGAYPVVRRLTRRLERLQSGVEALGAGDLSARVAVEGRDEIARLSTSFNSAAARIEQLVASHKMLLANASHELRTPLSRLKLGLELMQRGDIPSPDWPQRRAQLERDIGELDQLIEEILLASRLDAGGEAPAWEKVDLLGLAAEEAVHFDEATVSGEPVVIDGDPRLLRRLIRNLLENARRHGAPPVLITVGQTGQATAFLEVADQGRAIAAGEQERIFEPFYKATANPEGTAAPSGAVGLAKSATTGGVSAGSGIGLALVRTIARQHGGSASLVARQVAGNVFRIELPVTHVADAVSARPGRSAADIATATTRATPARSSVVLLSLAVLTLVAGNPGPASWEVGGLRAPHHRER